MNDDSYFPLLVHYKGDDFYEVVRTPYDLREMVSFVVIQTRVDK